MLGTVINSAAIVSGSVFGLVLGKGIPLRIKETIMQGLGLTVFLIGTQMALKTGYVLIVIVSLIIGGLIGEILNIEDRLTSLGNWLERKMGAAQGEVAKAFVTSSLIYCVGAMAIMGAIEDGLTGQYKTLFAKSLLDDSTAIFFASTMGYGVAFSALPVFIYQGIITLLASYAKDYLNPVVINELTATGGLLIVGIALNILEIKKIKVGNLLPAIFVAIVLTLTAQKIDLIG